MPHESRTQSEVRLDSSFDEVIRSAEVHSRQQDGAFQDYDPLEITAQHMQRAVEIERAWETIFREARENLLRTDPRQLYFDFFVDLKRQIEQNSSKSEVLSSMLQAVAIRGFGMSSQQIKVNRPLIGGTRYKVHLDEKVVQDHLDNHIVGEYFLNPITIDETVWDGRFPVIGASDVSQHRSAVPVPARFFSRSAPFVLNNAAGTLGIVQNGDMEYHNIFNPKPDEELLRWMLIDPSYREELEQEDYERCLTSAMDVGQYKFDLEYLLKADRRTPNLIFRDGSLFPQDAYLENFSRIENRRGIFTREAIRGFLNCLIYSKEIGAIYCGVSKNVQLKVYSTVVDWFISKYIDQNWKFGNYILNDGQMMSVLLASPSFVGDNLEQAVATCLIRRSFTTRANLNVKADIKNLDIHFSTFQDQHKEVDITPYQRLCELAHVYMFFIGHSKSPQQQIPRYEFFHPESFEDPRKVTQKILSGVQSCGFTTDEDHSFMADNEVEFLIPVVTHHAHTLSKDVGKYIDSSTGQWIMSRFQKMVKGKQE